MHMTKGEGVRSLLLTLGGVAVEDFGDEGLVGDAEGFGFLFEAVQVLAIDADVQDGVLAARGDGVRHQFYFVSGCGHILSAQQRALYGLLALGQFKVFHGSSPFSSIRLYLRLGNRVLRNTSPLLITQGATQTYP